MGNIDEAITRLYACTTEEDVLAILKRYPTRKLEKIVDLMLVTDYADTRAGCIAQIIGEWRLAKGSKPTADVAPVVAPHGWSVIEPHADAAPVVAAAESSDVDSGPIVVEITARQADVIDMFVGGSESLGAAVDAGVTWSKSRLIIPRTVRALCTMGFFVGMRTDIANDNLEYGQLDARTRGEYRATLNLARAFTEATGVSVDSGRVTHFDACVAVGVEPTAPCDCIITFHVPAAPVVDARTEVEAIAEAEAVAAAESSDVDAEARVRALVADMGADLLVMDATRPFDVNVWAPAGKAWIATGNHSLTGVDTDPDNGWRELYADMALGAEACTTPDCDTCTEAAVADAVRNLSDSGFQIEYAHRDDAEYGYLTWSRVHSKEYMAPEGSEPYVNLSAVGAEEDRTGQVSTCQRSNYRRLRADYPNAFTDVSYATGDVLGAFVADLVKADGLVNVLCGLATDYPSYDDSDMSELESEEIDAAWGQYLGSDAYAAMSEPVKAVWDGLTDRDYGSEIERQFYAAMRAADYYPEHDSYDVRWDDAWVKAHAEAAIVNTLRAHRTIAVEIARALYAEGQSWRTQGKLTGRDYSDYVREYAQAVTFIRKSLALTWVDDLLGMGA